MSTPDRDDLRPVSHRGHTGCECRSAPSDITRGAVEAEVEPAENTALCGALDAAEAAWAEWSSWNEGNPDESGSREADRQAFVTGYCAARVTP